MACRKCGDICVLISEECFCMYQPDGYTLKGNEYAIMMANISLQKCIGKCFDKLCDSNDVSIDEIMDSHNFKMFYSALIRYQIFCESKSTGKKAAEVEFKGDEQWSAASHITFSSKKKRLKCNIEDTQEEFLKWFNEQNYPCSRKEVTSSCGCKNPCECKDETDYDCGMIRL